MYRRSLRTRIAIAFALCVAVLSVAWGFAFFAAIKLTEDYVLQKQLQRAVESYPRLTTNLRTYNDAGSLPASLRKWAQKNPDVGLYEFDFDTEERLFGLRFTRQSCPSGTSSGSALLNRCS